MSFVSFSVEVNLRNNPGRQSHSHFQDAVALGFLMLAKESAEHGDCADSAHEFVVGTAAEEAEQEEYPDDMRW